ncbi:MAG: DUF4136 domain-containing protein [Gammaproteobacteria bacterium]|nr:DUF4136 domain-containing protein [Gammaproteobacteria bacterium]
MKTLIKFLLVMTAGTLAACGNPVQTEVDRHADIAGYRSFAWQAPEREEVHNPILDSDLMDKRMRTAVIRNLEDQGYVYDEDNPDFLVTYHTTTREKLRGSGFGTHMSMAQYHVQDDGSLLITPITPRRSHYYSSTVIHEAPAPRSYEEAVLIVDIIDSESETLVWRGWDRKRLTRKRFDTKSVRKAVEEILSEFPVAS